MLWSIAGLVGWSLAFVVIYGLHGIGCETGWDSIAVASTNLQRVVQVAAWLAFLPPLLMLALFLRRRRLQVAGRGPERWLAWLAETIGWVGLAATIITFAPAATASVCV